MTSKFVDHSRYIDFHTESRAVFEIFEQHSLMKTPEGQVPILCLVAVMEMVGKWPLTPVSLSDQPDVIVSNALRMADDLNYDYIVVELAEDADE